MNIIVCYKVVPDEQDAQVTADRTLSFERASLKIGDYDLNAVEAARQIAEAGDAHVISLTAGGDAVEDSKIRKGILARGPEENIAIKDESLATAEADVTARVLAAAIRSLDGADLILCGEGSSDLYAQQVGSQLGTVLGMPAINSVSSMTVEGGVAKLEREVGSEVQVLEVTLPAVISVIADMNEPKIPSMKDILAAGKKPSKVVTPQELGVDDLKGSMEIVSTLAPEQKERNLEIFEGSDEDTLQAFIARIQEQL